MGGADTWGQVKRIDGLFIPVASDYAGFSVALCGNQLEDAVWFGAINADSAQSNQGKTECHYKDDDGTDNWGYYTENTAQPGNANVQFGRGELSCINQVVVGGTPYHDQLGANTGHVNRLHRNKGGVDIWQLDGNPVLEAIHYGGSPGDRYGQGVALLSEQVQAVGSPGYSGGG